MTAEHPEKPEQNFPPRPQMSPMAEREVMTGDHQSQERFTVNLLSIHVFVPL